MDEVTSTVSASEDNVVESCGGGTGPGRVGSSERSGLLFCLPRHFSGLRSVPLLRLSLLVGCLFFAPACITDFSNRIIEPPDGCGDGNLDEGEQCDDGEANSDDVPDACRTDCSLPRCGDGVVDGGEACDDGNSSNDDLCFTACSGSADCCVPNVCHYHVDANTGNDGNDGRSDETPWQTLQKAAETVQAGETVCIYSGIYNERVTVETSGSDGNFITFKAYLGHEGQVVLDGTGIDFDSGGLFDIRGASYITVSGLTIINSAYHGLSVRRSMETSAIPEHINIQNLRVENSGDAAIHLYSTHHAFIKDCHTEESVSSGVGVWRSYNVVVENNTVINAANCSIAEGGHEEGIAISNTDTFEVMNNEVSYQGMEGYSFGAGIKIKESSRNGRVYQNYIHDIVTSDGIAVDAWEAGLVAGDPTLNNIDLAQNLVVNCDSGIALDSLAGGTAENIVVSNNLLLSLGSYGIVIPDSSLNGPRRNILIINNTIYESWGTDSAGIFVKTNNVIGIVIRNNISAFGSNVAGQIRSIFTLEVSGDHNLTFGGTQYPAEELSGSIEADPLFTDPISLTPEGFTLGAGSPAIDAGSEILAPPVDYWNVFRPIDGDGNGSSLVDIGACERE